MTATPTRSDDHRAAVVELWAAYAEILHAAAGLVEALPAESPDAPLARLALALESLRPPLLAVSDALEARDPAADLARLAADVLRGRA